MNPHAATAPPPPQDPQERPRVPALATEDVVRYAGTLVLAVGLALLVGTLAGAYGWIAAGALLLIVGGLVTVPLYRRKFEADANARELARGRAAREPYRGVPGGSDPAQDGGQAFTLPG